MKVQAVVRGTVDVEQNQVRADLKHGLGSGGCITDDVMRDAERAQMSPYMQRRRKLRFNNQYTGQAILSSQILWVIRSGIRVSKVRASGTIKG